MRSSSIFKKIEVVFHISSSWVRIRLHTKNQLPRLSRSGLKFNHSGVVWWGGVVWWWFFVSIIIPHQPSCFVLFCVVGWIVAIPLFLRQHPEQCTGKKILLYSNKVHFSFLLKKWDFILINSTLFKQHQVQCTVCTCVHLWKLGLYLN